MGVIAMQTIKAEDFEKLPMLEKSAILRSIRAGKGEYEVVGERERANKLYAEWKETHQIEWINKQLENY
jgi:hypothetical protein